MDPHQQQQNQDPILQALERAAGDDSSKIQSTKVVLEKKGGATEYTKAYYICHGSTIKFRHEGVEDKRPPVLCLRDLSDKSGKVLVYYSSSGSGKTAELVGSSASRGSHLAIVMAVEDPDEEQYNHMEDFADYNPVPTDELTSPSSQEIGMKKPARDAAMHDRKIDRLVADLAIGEKLKTLIAEKQQQLLPVVQAAVDSKQPLKLVLAIDEASACPRVIRGILRNPQYLKTVVEDAFTDVTSSKTFPSAFPFDLEISIAGTGVASSTIGSLPDNFTILKPYHEDNFETVINYNLEKAPLNLVVPWSFEIERFGSLTTIEERFPVLATLMCNGRLASISLAMLREYAENRKEIKEATLVDAIVHRFMKSNGMSQLLENAEEKRVVAASALAVHLFSKKKEFKVQVPKTNSKVAEWAQSMDFFSFSNDACSLRDLVKTYGLLEPSGEIKREHRGSIIAPPVKMTTPQQLIAVVMLGLDLSSMLEPTWFGFELMSTHLVKCALAASAAVCFEERPSAKDTLALLGFQSDPLATAGSVKETWNELENWAPVFTSAGESAGSYYSSTRQLKVGLKIVETEYQKSELLQIEENLKKSIMSATPRVMTGSVPPIACINEGNSDLCDGIVTFWARDFENPGITKKLSIMIQAKDYHENSTLDAKKLNNHAQTMSNTVLDGVFGDLRLLCVASASASLIATRAVQFEREYLPFAFNKGELLSDLLSKLKSQRSQSDRIAKYACFCDETGDKINGAQVSRKRKSPGAE